MRTLRLSLVGTVILALLGGLSATVLAQDEEAAASDAPTEVAPGAAPDSESQEAVAVRGGIRVFFGDPYKSGESYTGDGGSSISTGYGWQGRITEMSDPRLNGMFRMVLDEVTYSNAGDIITASIRIDNDEGSWIGTERGYRDPSSGWHSQALVSGSGAYEGLSALLFVVDNLSRLGEDMHGFIFPGAMPEAPEPPAPAE